ncbi:hypothetical protein [Halothiobacillus sp.]|uniref:hypothetical protein n=1 Tax=Halothiobacillus sp. TaxID=1891311 RepID=UPI002AD2CF19|nr:hypothetical protein [Halothiobacillus sp.]
MTGILNSDEIKKLVVLVEEAARSTEESVKYFIEPAPGTLDRSRTRRHHLIFGRRGSGKSSLLRKAASELTLDRRPIAYVNLEVFKGHTHPDVLLSVLISTFKKFNEWMKTAAIYSSTKKTFWQKLFGSIPNRKAYRKQDASNISIKIEKIITDLEKTLHQTDESDIKETFGSNVADQSKIGINISDPVLKSTSLNAESTFGSAETRNTEENFKRSKIDFLHRNVIQYQDIFNHLGTLSEGDAFLFMDDLYHIRRDDQARVIDYFHRIAKDNRLWLKIGTIRHRSTWYVHGDP